MKIADAIRCPGFPCSDTLKDSYAVPSADIDPAKIRAVIIAEAPPNEKADYFYAAGNPAYLQTALQAFRDAGANVNSIQDILDLGFYITTAIKCGKTGYAISPATQKNCAALLSREIALFPNVKVCLLGGDVAIRMMNAIWQQKTGKKVIPAGPTYKIRGQSYYCGDIQVFPSYTPAGKNFLIEKSKRRMVADDIRAALALIG